MKSIIINSVCKKGSTGSIAYGFHKYLKENGHESLICYGRYSEYPNEKDIIRVDNDLEVYVHAGLTRLTGLQGFFSNRATNKLLKLIEDYKPNVVYLLNLHGYYLNEFKLLNYLKAKGYCVVYIMPDEYPFLGKCCFQNACTKYLTECKRCQQIKIYPKSIFFDQSKNIFRRKDKIYSDFKNISFVSVPYNIKKARQSKLLSNKNLIEMDWGIDLKKTYYPRKTEHVLEKYSIPKNKRIILTVAPFNDERKGVKKYFFEIAKNTNKEDIVFINVGFNGKAEECPANFIPIKYVCDQNELAEIYSAADLFVTTSMADTMPLAALIALGCGTPICGFNISGLPYLATNKKYGNFVEAGNLAELQIAIENVLPKTKEKINECREYALSRFSDQDFFQKLLELGML